MTGDPRARARELAAEALAAGQPNAWFEQLYAEAAAGRAVVPWADLAPNPELAQWPGLAGPAHPGQRALVVGAGYGDDADLLTRLGWQTTGFDLAPSAVAGAAHRFPGTTFEVADLLAAPADWLRRFDLVVEVYTIQSMRGAPRSAAVAAVAGFVAPGGRLLVIAARRGPHDEPGRLPWPLTEDEVRSFPGLSLESLESLVDAGGTARWRATFRRPPG